MARCAITGKTTSFGIKYARRGAAKKKGGSGAKISGKTRRKFKPNLQTVRAIMPDGTIKRIKVCASAIKKGLVKKAPPRGFSSKQYKAAQAAAQE